MSKHFQFEQVSIVDFNFLIFEMEKVTTAFSIFWNLMNLWRNGENITIDIWLIQQFEYDCVCVCEFIPFVILQTS